MINYKQIYNQAFSDKNYNIHQMNEPRFKFVTDNVDFSRVNSILDIGCGRGLFLDYIDNTFSHVNTTGSDINTYTNNNRNFYELDVTNKIHWKKVPTFQLITCMDVLEHIEKQYMPFILKNIAKRCRSAIFTVANHEDRVGDVVLHITREKLVYWTQTIDKHFMILKMENINDVHYNFICVSRR